MKTVEIVTIGNEVLLGVVLDSNSNWLCKQITGLGGWVSRVVLVRDDIDAIAREMRGALERKVDLLFTVGGLGPTADDLTLQAVARATGHELEPNGSALALVRSRYETFYREGSVDSPELTEPRRKMAILPKEAVPLTNNVGAAPGVMLRLETGQTVVSLPGVPAEMKHIFSNSLTDTLRETFGSGGFVERTLITDCKDESMLAPVLSHISDGIKDVYIKSRPARFGPDVKLQITLALRGESGQEVTKRIDEVQKAIRSALHERGISVLEQRE